MADDIDKRNFTHIDGQGVKMVDVGNKKVSLRKAEAESIVVISPEIQKALKTSNFKTKKGPLFHTAQIAGIMAAKDCSRIIPLCHPLPLSQCDVGISNPEEGKIYIRSTVATTAKTGVEMEALTAASAAALTIYDMCKSISHEIIIRNTRLLRKTGGKSDINHE